MISVLIVEDSEHKGEHLKNALIECGVVRENVSIAKNVKDAKRLLIENLYDVLLLDLVLPINAESEPTQDAGIKFLDEIYYRNAIKIPAHIIGVTQFDELFDKYNDNFDDKLWHLINFDSTTSEWKSKLTSKIEYIIQNKKEYLESLKKLNDYDIGILCALNEPEYSELLSSWEHFKQENFENDPIDYYQTTLVSDSDNSFKIISCSINHMGMHSSAAIASKMIAKFNLKYIFIVGICAGIRERGINLGDIVIANTIWDHGSGKIVENDTRELIFKPEPYNYATNEYLLSKLNTFLRKKEFLLKIQNDWKGTKPSTLLNAMIGPVASGSYVISSKSYLNEIIQHNRKLLGIDMEGYGVYRASSFFKDCSALMIKSVCDFADEEKNDNHQNYAAYTSAAFLYHFIKSEF